MCEEDKEKIMKDDTRALAWYRRGVVAVGVGALLIGAHALAATPPTIGIKEFKYGPSMLTVPVGTTVTWVNHDQEPHTVTSRTGALRSPRSATRRSVSGARRTRTPQPPSNRSSTV